ncbi:MAG: TPM domain-containing protein [Synechococcales cyanobacterium]
MPVLDLAQLLTTSEESQLNAQISQFEQDTGWKLRVLTQFDQSPGRQVKEYWDLNEKSVLMVADPKGGNLLAFNVGDAVREILPRTFWVELQSRFGNQFFTREHGDDFAIQATVNTLETCFRQGGCRVVPGLPQEQWLLTLITSMAGGIILGFAGKPRHNHEFFNWRWALLFSPLWFILFGVFGVGPVISRTQEWMPLLRNGLAFAGAVLLIYVAPIKTRWQTDEE